MAHLDKLLAACIAGLVGCGVSSTLDQSAVDSPKSVTTDAGLDAGDAGDAGDAKSKGPCEGEGECGPDDLRGESCDSLGLGEGTLECDESTCTFDTSMCDGMPSGGGGMGGGPGFGGPSGEPQGTGDGDQNDRCDDNSDCGPTLTCYAPGNFCSLPCTSTRDCNDLSGADWTCDTTSTGLCRVICEDDGDCPNGFECTDVAQGILRCTR